MLAAYAGAQVTAPPVPKKPTDTQPKEVQPADASPKKTEPAKTEPTQTAPASTKPAETKPVETKPAETEPAQGKPAQTAPAQGKTPLPKVPAEQAERINLAEPPPLPGEDELIQAEAEADLAMGQTELILKDRRRIIGRIVGTTAESVTISIAGVATTFSIKEVESIRKLPPLEEQHERLRAATRDDDVEGLLRLAEWLRSRGRYTLALREISDALIADPTNRAAIEQRTLIEQQQRIAHVSRWREAQREKERLARAANPGVIENPDAEPQEEPEPVRRRLFPLLTEDQINILRVFETDLNDPPKMRITRETIDDFLDKYAGQTVEGRGTVPVSPDGRDLFARQRPVEILRWFFDVRAREFYPRVEVQENPRALRLFRDTVHRTWLINSCSTNKCHGGEEAGRLYLYNRNPSRDESAMTNLFIIDNYRTKDGLPLIDYREPERSLLLQYGLPRNQTVTPHPDVEGISRRWQPTFDSPDDRRFREAVNWIRSMYPNRTGYPIDYTPPVPGQLDSKAAPEPAVAPR
jgi:hypothetical protein